jgi:4,5-DOPA dioxygenase extradiol
MNRTMPALFIGHGSPLQAIEPGTYTAGWQQLARALPRPRAILAVSAHWYTRGTGVTAMAQPTTIHDFKGFPAALSEVVYAAPGDPLLAARVQALLRPASVQQDQDWGLDHGTWSVLRYLYPDADVPVVQLSIDASLPAAAHYTLAQRLAPLRDEGVLVLGSGNVVHNLGAVQWSARATPAPWALEFNDIVRASILADDHARLVNYEQLGAAARLCVPTPEHFLPLLYVLALQRSGESASLPIDGIEMASIGMLCVKLGQ